jgi:hypothetical protein
LNAALEAASRFASARFVFIVAFGSATIATARS